MRTEKIYKFPLGDAATAFATPVPTPTRAPLARAYARQTNSDEKGKFDRYSYMLVFLFPTTLLGLIFGLGAGASLEDNQITMHASNVAIIWCFSLAFHLVFGITWTFCIELRISDAFFERYNTQKPEDCFEQLKSEKEEAVEGRQGVFRLIPPQFVQRKVCTVRSNSARTRTPFLTI